MKIEFFGTMVEVTGPAYSTATPADIRPQNDWLQPDAAFVENVRQFGVVEPVVFLRAKNGTTAELVSGRRRVMAAVECHLPAIPALTYTLESDDDSWLGIAAAELTVILNAMRRENPIADARRIAAMKQRGMTAKQISVATGMPLATIEARERLLDLPDELVTAVAFGTIKVSVGEAVAKLPLGDRVRARALFASKGKLAMSDVAELRTAVRTEASTAMLDGLGDLMAEVATVVTVPALTDILAKLDSESLILMRRDLAYHPSMAAVVTMIDRFI
jgi:ParB-like chromosome segregation protein Spo0J